MTFELRTTTTNWSQNLIVVESRMKSMTQLIQSLMRTRMRTRSLRRLSKIRWFNHTSIQTFLIWTIRSLMQKLNDLKLFKCQTIQFRKTTMISSKQSQSTRNFVLDDQLLQSEKIFENEKDSSADSTEQSSITIITRRKKIRKSAFLLIAKFASLKMRFLDLIIRSYKFHVNFSQKIVQTWSTIRTMSNKCQNLTFTWCALCMRSITMKVSISITFRNFELSWSSKVISLKKVKKDHEDWNDLSNREQDLEIDQTFIWTRCYHKSLNV